MTVKDVRPGEESVDSAQPQVATWVFVALCALAGALAVPVDAVASPVSTLVAGLAAYLGLRLWRWSRLPGLVEPEVGGALRRVVRRAEWLGVGLAVGLLLLAAIRLAIEPSIPAAGARIAAAGGLPLWRRLAIIYVAAIGEEILFRLLLLSALAGLTMQLLRRGVETPSRGVVRLAIALAALAFAAVHLPSWSAIGPLSFGLAAMVMGLNAVGGLVFGHVFVTRGIVAAMWVHAGADCAIQLIGPLTS
jgi:hypothetical protein